MSSSKVGKVLAILAVAVVFGGLFGWWISRQGGAASSGGPKTSQGGTVPPGHSRLGNLDTNVQDVTAQDTNMIKVVPEGTEEKDRPKDYGEQLDAIILGPEDEGKKLGMLIAIMKVAPAEVALEYSQHAINFAQDDNYSGLAGILTNSATSSGVATVLMNDLLNRNNALKLPMLLAVAQTDDHSLKGEAKEMLELFIQEDHGTNWTEWSEAIDKWLKENPQ